MKRIAFLGTDVRTFLWAYQVSQVDGFLGVVIRGSAAMPKYAEIMGWDVEFIPTKSNSVPDYAEACIDAFRAGRIDMIVIMPEDPLFNGLVDVLIDAGFGDSVIGLDKKASFIEGDKIACKKFCEEAGIPVEDMWIEKNARDYDSILKACLECFDRSNGAVITYPFSAGGKGTRVVTRITDIREVYDGLMTDFTKKYQSMFGEEGYWPLLVKSYMSGVEISFTILIDGNGNYQVLPTAMDYPERYEGPPGKGNPVTGGMGSVSPHPYDTKALTRMAERRIAVPLVKKMKELGMLRPCILYPNCIVSLNIYGLPVRMRVTEINIRIGEPEGQTVGWLLMNIPQLMAAAIEGNLDKVKPLVRENQVCISIALVTGPGGPQQQKGYPYSCTKHEKALISSKYLKKKRIWLFPSGADWSESHESFISDGTRVFYIMATSALKEGETRGDAAERAKAKLYRALDEKKVVVIPREWLIACNDLDELGKERGKKSPEYLDALREFKKISENRLAWRSDIGAAFRIAEDSFPLLRTHFLGRKKG